MIFSRLFLKIFLGMMVVIMTLSTAVYLWSVPLIQERTFQIEVNASRTILNNVFEMAEVSAHNLSKQNQLAMEKVKTELKTVIELAATSVVNQFESAERGIISKEQARSLAFEGLRKFRFSNNNYVWMANHKAVVVSHPDPAIHGRDANNVDETNSRELTIPKKIVDMARRDQEGFYEYSWRKLNSLKPTQKIAYFLNLPKLELVISGGVHLAEVEATVKKRKQEATDRLRQALRGIEIAKTGYAYIFDASDTMIIHPNTNIEGMDFSTRVNPASNRSLSLDLKAAAHQKKPLYYLWDKPTDPGNYTYKKISWVRHFKSFDWYIASSVYVEELKKNSDELSNRILMVALGISAIATVLSYFSIMRLIRPIHQLASTAKLVQAGNLAVRSNVSRRDELGILATAFDSMIAQVSENMVSLSQRVRDRTSKLEKTNTSLNKALDDGKRYQKRVVEAGQRQRLILDAIPIAIVYLSQKQTIEFANAHWAMLFECDASQVLKQRLFTVLPPEIYSEFSQSFPKATSGPVGFEHVYSRANQTTKLLKTTIIAQRTAAGQTIGHFILTEDVTEDREIETRLRKVESLTVVGQLAGGLAHDFNNVLSIILGNLVAARSDFDEVVGLSAYLEPAERASRRCADITDRLLTFSRGQPLNTESVDVNALLEDVISLLKYSFFDETNISVLVTASKKCWANVDVHQLERMLINLAINARDEMPNGGELVFELHHVHVDGLEVRDEVVAPGKYVEIIVSDTGSGFAPDVATRAFEPFYTTKGRGTGLGLSMAHGFVKQSGGYITIECRNGERTKIRVLLPSTEKSPLKFSSTETLPKIGTYKGKVALLVDDDRDVRKVLVAQLARLGFSVIEANDGHKALRLLKQMEQIDLVVSDVVMPGKSGIEVARKVRDDKPKAAIVLTSGYSTNKSGLKDFTVLKKPWEEVDLFISIQQAMKQPECQPEEGEHV